MNHAPAWTQVGEGFASRIANRAASLASWVDRRIRPGLARREDAWRPIWNPDDTGLKSKNWAEKLVLPIHTMVESLMSRLERTLSSTDDPIRFSWAAPLRGIVRNIFQRTDDRRTGHATGMAQYEIPAHYRNDADSPPETDKPTGDTDSSPEDYESNLPQQVPIMSQEQVDRMPQTDKTAGHMDSILEEYEYSLTPQVPVTNSDGTPNIIKDSKPSVSGLEATDELPEEPQDTMSPASGFVEAVPRSGQRRSFAPRHIRPRHPPTVAGEVQSFASATQQRVQPPKSPSGETEGTTSPVPYAEEGPGHMSPQRQDTDLSAESVELPRKRAPYTATYRTLPEAAGEVGGPAHDSHERGAPGWQPQPIAAEPVGPFRRQETGQDSGAVSEGAPQVPADDMTGQPHQAKAVDEPGVSMPVARHTEPSPSDKETDDSPARSPYEIEMADTPLSLTEAAEPIRAEHPIPPDTRFYDGEESQGIRSAPPLPHVVVDARLRQPAVTDSIRRGVASPASPFTRFTTPGSAGIQRARREEGREADSDIEGQWSTAFPETEADLEEHSETVPDAHPTGESHSGPRGNMAAVPHTIMTAKGRGAAQAYHNEESYIDESVNESDDWIMAGRPAAIPVSHPRRGRSIRRMTGDERLPVAVAARASGTVSAGVQSVAMAPLDRSTEHSGAVIQRAIDTSSPAQPEAAGVAQPDIDDLARDVYQIIRHRLALEKERHASRS